VNTILIYALCWFGMAVIGIGNGIVRQYVYGPFMRELAAHQVSTLTGIVVMGFYVWWLTGLRRLASTRQALVVGALWLVMTAAFEFGFGHYVVGHPWTKLIHDYNIAEGRVWVLVLLWITMAPWVFYRMRSKVKPRQVQ